MVYVSRALMEGVSGWSERSSGSLIPGRALDDAFSAAGYRVFHPETTSINTQIDTYRGAETLVLDEGSALHLAGLVAAPETLIVVLCRRPWYRMLIEGHLRILLGPQARIVVRMVEGEVTQRGPHSVSIRPDPARLAALLVAAGAPPVTLAPDSGPV